MSTPATTHTPVSPDLRDALATSRALLGRIRKEWPTGGTGPSCLCENRRVVIDVTDRLTPGGRAAAVQRSQITEAMAAAYRYRDAAEQQMADAFTAGQAYERGAAVARMPGGGRESVALRRARTYLENGDPRGAALVLAGYTGTAVL